MQIEIKVEVRLRDHAPAVSLEPPLRDSAPSLNSVLGSPSKVRPSSVIATKNTRKRMEDRHVVLHDLKAYLPSALQTKVRLLYKMKMIMLKGSLKKTGGSGASFVNKKNHS